MLGETLLKPSFPEVLVAEEDTSERTLVPCAPVQPALREQLLAVLARSSREHVPIRYLGTMSIFSGHRVYPGRVYDWVLVNLAEDPLFHDRDGFPIPRRVLLHLQAIRQAGIEFHALYVAHEVRKDTIREGDRLMAEALMPPAPRAVKQLSRQLGRAGAALWALSVAPLVVSVAMGTMTGAGALVIAPAIGLAAASCMTGDPVLMGTIVSPGKPVRAGDPACWFYLTHWGYDEEV